MGCRPCPPQEPELLLLSVLRKLTPSHLYNSIQLTSCYVYSVHPNGSIADFLVAAGLAKVIDVS